MDIFHKTTLQMLKKNKIRTLMTIIGVVLATALICMITTFLNSALDYLVADAIYENGSYHGAVTDAQNATIEQLLADERIDKMAVRQGLGYARLEQYQNSKKPYLYVEGINAEYLEIMPVHLVEGRLPEKEGEILLPDHLEADNGLTYAPGDVLLLELGERRAGELLLGQADIFEAENEVFAATKNKEYTVVGVYERPDWEEAAAPGYTVLTLCNERIQRQDNYYIAFTLHNPTQLRDFMEEYELGFWRNIEYLLYSGYDRQDNWFLFVGGFVAVLIGIIVIASVSLIYNAFAISVSERTRQFGIMVSVGATKKQIRKSVLFEAVFSSAIGIPIGFLCGIGSVGLILHFLEEEIKTLVPYSTVPFALHVSWASVLATCVIAFVTVLISAWMPARRATKVNAIEAIRQTKDIQVKKNEAKSNGLLPRMFGVEGMMAQKHFRRNRKRYRTTVISLCMSMVLFVAAGGLGLYFIDTFNNLTDVSRFDLRCFSGELSVASPQMETDYQRILNMEGITDAAYAVTFDQFFKIPESYVAEDYINFYCKNQQEQWAAWGVTEESAKEGLVEQLEYYRGILFFVNDATYEVWLREYGLDPAVFMNTDAPVAVAFSAIPFWDQEDRLYRYELLKKEPGEIIMYQYPGTPIKEIDWYDRSEGGEAVFLWEDGGVEIPASQMNHIPLQIGATVSYRDLPFFVEMDSQLFLMYPYSAIPTLLGWDYQTLWSPRIVYTMLSDDHNASYAALEKYYKPFGIAITDQVAEEERTRNILQLIHLFVYLLTAMIAFVAVANIFNTITTNLQLRSREFAMLKSMGMSGKGVGKMLFLECFLYGVKAILYGMLISVGITYCLYLLTKAMLLNDVPFMLPWGAMIAACCGIFVIIGIAAFYAMRKIQRENTVDVLKNENL